MNVYYIESNEKVVISYEINFTKYQVQEKLL